MASVCTTSRDVLDRTPRRLPGVIEPDAARLERSRELDPGRVVFDSRLEPMRDDRREICERLQEVVRPQLVCGREGEVGGADCGAVVASSPVRLGE
jgi:hypothetical protein